jgi:RNase H-like domain found in reverse transcriptase/Reverse transcriptase (RNA-dependent DNA polymerase)/Integrase zinc binding domain/Retroviral aspartyl protease
VAPLLPEQHALLSFGAVFPPPPVPGNEDRMFLRSEFARIEALVGHQFTLDAACNDSGDNAHCARYCSPANPFLSHALAGERVWCNPPFRPQLLTEWLAHYRTAKCSAPATTSAVFVVPKWEPFTDLFEQPADFVLLHEYAAGTVLHSEPSACKPGERVALPGVPWPVQVWYSAPERRGTIKQLGPPTSHTMRFAATTQGVPLSVLLDSGACTTGAADGYVSQAVVNALQLSIRHSDVTHVTVASGATEQLIGEVTLRLKLQRVPLEVRLLVMASGNLPDTEVILGADWLHRKRVILDWHAGVAKIQKGGKHVSLRPTPMEQDPAVVGPEAATKAQMERNPELLGPDGSARAMLGMSSAGRPRTLISAKATCKAMQRGARAFLVNVRQSDAAASAQAALVSATCAKATTLLTPSGVSGVEGLVKASAITGLLKEYEDVFRPLDSMPPKRDSAHSIHLEPNKYAPSKRMYRLSQREREEVERQIAELLKLGYIQPSTSPFGAPVLFVDKPDGSLRMCLDYRALNEITVKRRFAMPNITDLFDQLSGASVFSSLDLQQGYYQIRIPEADVPKTAFMTHIGQFEYKVLCMGLTNAPATFQETMNGVFGDRIGRFVLVYLDDILVFSKTPEEHVEHLREVLELLRKHEFRAKLSKCEFNKAELKFLGHIISREGLRVDPGKVLVVQNWPVPTGLPQLRSFLGLANYFRRFIMGYSTLAAPLTFLTGSKAAWLWTPKCQQAFEEIKSALTRAPVLRLPDNVNPFTIISDASIYGTGAVLLQDGVVVAYASSKFDSAQTNYTTTDQECLGVIRALEEWRCYVEGRQVTLITDHQPLTHLQAQRGQGLLSRRQARWMEFLSRFDFKWEYQPGRINVADPLSRLHGPQLNTIILVRGGTAWQGVRGKAQRLPAHRLILAALRCSTISFDLKGRLVEGYADDPQFAALAESDPEMQLDTASGLWLKDGKVVVPDAGGLRTLIIREHHDGGFGGHRGRDRTMEAISRVFWWSSLDADAAQYVSLCPECQRSKSSNAKPSGQLKPIIIIITLRRADQPAWIKGARHDEPPAPVGGGGFTKHPATARKYFLEASP